MKIMIIVFSTGEWEICIIHNIFQSTEMARARNNLQILTRFPKMWESLFISPCIPDSQRAL